MVDLYFIHVTGIVLCATLVSNHQYHQCDRAKLHTLYKPRNYQPDCGKLHLIRASASFQFLLLSLTLKGK